jgi:glutaminase
MTTPAATHEVQSLIDDLHAQYLSIDEGEVATYIPELAKADPDKFGVSVATSDGRIFEAGDCEHRFTIQSVSKPFTFGIALEELGHEAVSAYVGVEPSGDPFNSIELQPGTNRPFNPMVNSGAIAITALLHARYGDATIDCILDRLSTLAGRPLTIDDDVYASERRTGHRNRAIAHLLLNFGMLQSRDLAVMAAALSNMGRNPITGRIAYDPHAVKDMLSIMFTCGMYDSSGQWAYRVGVPAKSGVGGGIIAVVNRQLGIGTYSPRLDKFGNSRRGVEVCVQLAARLGLHVFDCLNSGSSYLSGIL